MTPSLFLLVFLIGGALVCAHFWGRIGMALYASGLIASLLVLVIVSAKRAQH